MGELEELTGAARRMAADGDLDAALALLGEVVLFFDPKPGRASRAQAEAAALYAHLAASAGEPHTAKRWAGYAHGALRRIHGDHDRRTLAAAGVLAAVLHQTGGLRQAAHHYRRLQHRLSDLDGPDSGAALAAAADLATVLHTQGECAAARTLLTDTLRAHQHRYRAGHRDGIRMLARLAIMARDCGDFTAAHDLLGAARRLCATHLDSDDPLTAQVSAAARRPADRHHHCQAAPGPPAAAAW